MEKNKKQEGMSMKSKVLIGVGAAAAVATAGAIFLYGTEAGKKTRKEIKSWMLKMKADVLDQMENMKEWSESAYHAVVDSVAEKYKQMKHIDVAELSAIVADLKSHWKIIERELHKKSGKNSPQSKGKKKERIIKAEEKFPE